MGNNGVDPEAAAEQALMERLFTPEGRVDPVAAARVEPVAGCSHRFVTEALHDRRFAAAPIPPSPDLMFQVAARFLSRMPTDRHRLTRAAFTGVFSPRRIERYRERVARTAAGLIDALPDRGPVDLVPTFTRPLPFAVICHVLGVPESQHAWLAERMETFGRGVAGQRERADVDAGNLAAEEMLTFFGELLDRRAAAPADDLLTLLATEQASGASREDLLANCVFFVLAGHATTSTLLAAGVDRLCAHPGQLARLRADPAAWPAAVEELLRFVSPTTLTGVTAVEDAEVAGCPVPAGARRALVFTAANRDPEVFADPDTLDLARTPNPHVAFAAGPHYCLGAPLARLHAEVALALLFDRLAGLRVLDGPDWLGSVPIRQVARLTVDWR